MESEIIATSSQQVRPRSLNLVRAPIERAGFVSVLNRCSARCRLCLPLGCLHAEERGEDSLVTTLRSLKAAHLHFATFPPNTVQYKYRAAITRSCRELQITPILRISSSFGIIAYRNEILEWIAEGGRIEAVLDQVWNEGELEFLRQINGHIGEGLSVCVVPRAGTDCGMIIDSLPANLASRAEFLFPIKLSADDDFLSCDESRALIQTLCQLRPDLRVQPYRGFDLIDASHPVGFDNEPNLAPVLKNSSLAAAPEISVIVPTYNRKNTVINTLRHLQRQDFNVERYEVILVDDGSDDGTLERVREHLSRSPSRFNLKYLFVPRPSQHKPGDFSFRTGIARNLGAKHAVGQILVFVDSDILVPPDFIADIRQQHATADVIQYQQVQIPFKKGSQRPRYQELEPGAHGVRSEGGHWERFYSRPDWQSLPNFWKYVSAACLSVKREHFDACGGFARAFLSYGFEDTLLGWQLARMDSLRWSLRRKPVFHLRPSDEESEYGNSSMRRRLLMARSAKIFYAITLDDGFYRDFFPLLGERVRLRSLFAAISNWLAGRALLSILYGALLLTREPERARRMMREANDVLRTTYRRFVDFMRRKSP